MSAQTINMESDTGSKAGMLAHKYIIVDGHIDLPYRLKVRNFRLEREYLRIPIQSDSGDFDYTRAKEGGLDAPFMSIFIPSEYELKNPKIYADSLIRLVEGIIDAHPDKFAKAGSPAEIEKNFSLGKISMPMGMENGAPLEGDLKNVSYFHNRGIRYITLTHAKNNHISDSSYDTTRTWNGLSPFGREVVAEMNRTGTMVDISHVSDSAFYQVISLTRVPVIASHSSCRKFTPGFERNMNDDMIKELGENGGVIMINFGSSFLDGAIEKNRTELENLLKSKKLKYTDKAAKKVITDFSKSHPELFSDVERVADHIDHVVSLVGVDHVGFGSDFDGVGDSLPVGLKDVSAYPNLIDALLKRGYSDDDIEKICCKNLFRVWNEVLDFAQAH
jgi:membrane dipeptidase